jgi:hypothetical protein
VTSEKYHLNVLLIYISLTVNDIVFFFCLRFIFIFLLLTICILSPFFCWVVGLWFLECCYILRKITPFVTDTINVNFFWVCHLFDLINGFSNKILYLWKQINLCFPSFIFSELDYVAQTSVEQRGSRILLPQPPEARLHMLRLQDYATVFPFMDSRFWVINFRIYFISDPLCLYPCLW